MPTKKRLEKIFPFFFYLFFFYFSLKFFAIIIFFKFFFQSAVVGFEHAYSELWRLVLPLRVIHIKYFSSKNMMNSFFHFFFRFSFRFFNLFHCSLYYRIFLYLKFMSFNIFFSLTPYCQ